MTNHPPDPLLTVRAAMVLLLASGTGLFAGVLGCLSHRDLPSGALIGGGAAGAALLLFHRVLGR